MYIYGIYDDHYSYDIYAYISEYIYEVYIVHNIVYIYHTFVVADLNRSHRKTTTKVLMYFKKWMEIIGGKSWLKSCDTSTMNTKISLVFLYYFIINYTFPIIKWKAVYYLVVYIPKDKQSYLIINTNQY